MPKPSAGQADKRAADMERVLAYMSQGMSQGAAARLCGRHPRTITVWKHSSSTFKERLERIVARQKGEIHDATVDETGAPIDTRSTAGFRKRYFKYDTFHHQHQVIDAIESAPPGSRVMVLLPPEWGKTTVVEDWICKTLAELPNNRICYLSESLGHAKKCLGRIKRRMTDRSIAKDFIDDYGPFKAPDRESAKPWNSEWITVFGSTHDEGDYSLECRGSTSNIQGSRYDKMILDDVQSKKSLGRTQTLIELFRQDWQTRVSKSGSIVIIATRVGKGDFNEELLKLGLIDILVLIPALDAAGHSNFPPPLDADGNRLRTAGGDPMGWTEEELEKRHNEVGDDIWERVYMQSGRSTGAGPFRPDRIELCMDNDREPGGKFSPVFDRGHRGLGRISGIDPALGGYCALVSCSYDGDRLYVEGIRNEPNLQRNEEIFAIVEQETVKHLPECWVWERNNLQHGMARDDRLMALRDKYGFYILEHYTDEKKLDDKIGIPSMAGAVHRGEIRFPGTLEGRDLCATLIEQLIDWRVDVPAKLLRQDLVMALWFCYLRWQQIKGNLQQDLSAFDRTASPMFTPYQTTIGTWR